MPSHYDSHDKPKSKIKTMMKKTEQTPKMKKKIIDRTTLDLINNNVKKIIPKGSSEAKKLKIKKEFIKKYETQKIKKGKTEAESLMNIGKAVFSTRDFIENKIKKGEL